MYIEDLKKEFYSQILGKQILVLVHLDVDGICAWRIIQQLLQGEGAGVVYSVRGVASLEQLCEAFQHHTAATSISHCLLINCGATHDLVELLRPPDNMVLYVLDSHRPIDVCNVYSNGQVRVLGRDTGETVPNFDDIFREDNESSDEDEEDEFENEEVRESRVERLQRKAEERREKRRERMAWENNRDTLMFNYTQFSYFSKPSALRMVELAWQLSRDTWEMVWWGAVGLTEQLVLDKMEIPSYSVEAQTLQQHAQRLSHNAAHVGGAVIALEPDLLLPLYRHWNLESSLRHSPCAWGRLRLWGARGTVRLQRLLADMGLPLRQARQLYCAMELGLRKELLPSLERLKDKYGLEDLHYLAFCLRVGYGTRLCAADVVYSTLGLLESPSDDNTEEGFRRALKALQPGDVGVDDFKKGLESARIQLQSLGHNVEGAVRAQQVVSAGPFMYVVLTGSCGIGGGVHWLGVLARWLQRGAPYPRLPLIVATPAGTSETHSLLVGVPPLTEDSTRNLFGKAFEQAAVKSQSSLEAGYLDPCIVSLPQDHLNKFLDALTTLLT